MNVSGVVGAVDAHDAPFQKEFLDTINFVDAPRPPEPALPLPAPAASRSPSPVQLPRRGVGLGKDRAWQMRREERELENRRAQETSEQSTSSAAKKAKNQ